MTQSPRFARSMFVAIAALASCIPGCESAQTVKQAASAATQLFGDWNLSSLSGTDLSKLAAEGVKTPNLSIASDGKVSGFSGVNRLSSSVDLNALAAGKFKLAPVASTLMAGSPAANSLEQSFTGALAKADAFKVSGDRLTLSNGAQELMAFVRGK